MLQPCVWLLHPSLVFLILNVFEGGRVNSRVKLLKEIFSFFEQLICLNSITCECSQFCWFKFYMLVILCFGVQWNNLSGRVWRVFGTGKRKWWNLSVSYILNARNKHEINHLSFTILLLFFQSGFRNCASWCRFKLFMWIKIPGAKRWWDFSVSETLYRLNVIIVQQIVFSSLSSAVNFLTKPRNPVVRWRHNQINMMKFVSKSFNW